jgi:undecaprenyl diphosphate synthase
MAGQLGTEVVTLYTFSSENWKRPRSEISALMSLLLNTIKEEVDELDEKNVRLMTIGDLKRLPIAPRLGVKQTIDRLSKNDGLLVNLALSYSGRDELVSAMQEIARQVKDGTLDVDEIDTAVIDQTLQTHGLPEPDLLIRTSGEMRLSNFILWQLAYTEMYVTRTLWPDFREPQFLDAIENFQHRERRYGCVSEQIANTNMI